MALRINYNLASASAQRGLGASQDAYAKQATRLSTGLRINSASDDAAGMAVSEKLKNQVRGLNQAQRNAQDGVSLVQTAEAGLSETHSLLARMRELAVQASNDTLSASDRANLDAEFTQLSAEIDRISSTVAFNGIYLLNSGMSTGLTLQIGANNGDTFTLTIQGAQYSTLYANNTVLTVTTIGFQSAASAVISAIDTTVNAVSTRRANLGALQSRLESVGRSIAVASENTAAANSRVADADIAASMSDLVRAQILQQAGISVLAQANQAPALVLQLLK
ncbi:MAG: flagellin FliC [Proteobacteria bacterium]|jgi:flagellin|nr:flagellin FliC [Pseudomonadota bacterium]NBT04919.1 flagellin FliC [Pseudomonadota bacterium]NBT20388.1 flagellin FliC [Pseudomonadota bacterium]NBT26905.1 flagellin FliC [Actinomycetota bacterium]